MAKHALISPSSCERIAYCPASVLLSKDAPEDSSPYAEEGTAAHRWCELELRAKFAGRDLNRAEAAERAAIKLSHDGMEPHVREYVSHVAELAGGALYRAVEVRLPVTPITGEPDAFGTADCVVIDGDGVLHIIDFKYGAGVKVEAKHNAQLGVYALAAMAELDPEGMMFGIEKVVLHIIQSRMDNISEWAVDRAALEGEFFTNIRRAADRALHLVAHPEDLKEDYPFLPLEGSGMTPEGDFAIPNDPICRFCKAKAICPILHRSTVEALEADFEDLADGAEAEQAAPAAVALPSSIPVPTTPERLAAAYSWLKVIRMWCDAVEGAMYDRLNSHGETEGYKLVAGRPGPRKWTDAEAAEAELRKALKVDQAYDRKVISPTTAEKLHKAGEIGPKYWARLSNLIGRSDGKPLIVPSTDERPALTPQLENDFDDLDPKAEQAN